MQDDFQERPSVWKTQPCFVVKVRPYSSSPAAIVFVEAFLKFKLVNAYPKVPAAVEVPLVVTMQIQLMSTISSIAAIIFLFCT